MPRIILDNITIEVDKTRTEEFYKNHDGFSCPCPDCTSYVAKIDKVRRDLNGLDLELGIDLTKDVGQGMDELMGHENDNHHIYVIPYYISGKCFIDSTELEVQQSGPIRPNTKRAEYKLTNELVLLIINTTGDIEFDNSENVLSVWLEYKTEPRN
ncbi:MAG: hypothetical protein ACFHU9_00575 [Fluviicola sp.]